MATGGSGRARRVTASTSTACSSTIGSSWAGGEAARYASSVTATDAALCSGFATGSVPASSLCVIASNKCLDDALTGSCSSHAVVPSSVSSSHLFPPENAEADGTVPSSSPRSSPRSILRCSASSASACTAANKLWIELDRTAPSALGADKAPST